MLWQKARANNRAGFASKFSFHFVRQVLKFPLEASLMRRNLALTALFISTFFAATRGHAQSAVLDLPRDSQHAKVLQRVGITDITINYHRPLVKGRKVWGGLVPYGQVWRAGANENTTIEFSDPVSVEGKPLAKGTYGLHMLPTENEWTIIFSKTAAAWGSFTYNQAEDALRVTVKPRSAEMKEALAYEVDDVTPTSAIFTLRWEKLAVPFKVEVDTHDIVAQSLHKQLRGLAQYTWDGWDDAANYFLTNKYNLEEALKYEDRSIGVEERYDNLMNKSRILDALNRKDEATVARNKALGMATITQLHTYGRQLQLAGKQDQAFEVFRSNIKKDPNHWLVRTEAARLAVAKGDFDGAVKEMKLALAAAPDPAKSTVEGLVKRLEDKQDINK
jgi:tetratricopeptide (TPR) repeat protein